MAVLLNQSATPAGRDIINRGLVPLPLIGLLVARPLFEHVYELHIRK